MLDGRDITSESPAEGPIHSWLAAYYIRCWAQRTLGLESIEAVQLATDVWQRACALYDDTRGCPDGLSYGDLFPRTGAGIVYERKPRWPPIPRQPTRRQIEAAQMAHVRHGASAFHLWLKPREPWHGLLTQAAFTYADSPHAAHPYLAPPVPPG